MAVVSADHGSEDLHPSHIRIEKNSAARGPRLFSPKDIRELNQPRDSEKKKQKKSTTAPHALYGVIDGFVCDCSDFVHNAEAHPGGIKKLLAVNDARVGATGEDYGFSFTRGRNAHFPDTGQTFQDGVRAYLEGGGGSTSGGGKSAEYLDPVEVVFKPW
eukprot:CAMPEP_0167779910 /NCGR_PEP_ID=MMETSP0111_2-20121227/5067_1 /TAXON_ID=91324 /ORGANISM="Lotharella globosa, Strain CCCM811" /LENGTH=158 /DNA_ID=CAMNT_0007670369 /DNA_START=56 /DNA_END=529 /DNA_ORIENTATION=+